MTVVDGERRMNGSGSEIEGSFKARNLSRDDIQYRPRTTRVCEPQTSRSAVAAAAVARRQIPRYGTSTPGP